MASLRTTLPPSLLEQALKAETSEKRALAVQAIGRSVRDLELSETDREFAEQLFDAISRDVSEEVRRALAVTLRLSPNLPRNIANRLLFDLDSIAVPILSGSPMVTDADLISVLRSRLSAKVKAIATRSGLSERLSGAIISTGDTDAIATLAANDTALISESDAARLVTLGEKVDLIREATLSREDIPARLKIRLINRQVDDIDLKLSEDDELRERVTLRGQLMDDTRSRSFAGYAGQDWPAEALTHYVDTLAERGHLKDGVIARAAGQGDWRFVQLALAKRANVPASKAGLMAFDALPFPLTALCTRADLGPACTALLQASRQAYLDLERSGLSLSRREFQRLMGERVSSHPTAHLYEGQWMDWIDDGLTPRIAASA